MILMMTMMVVVAVVVSLGDCSKHEQEGPGKSYHSGNLLGAKNSFSSCVGAITPVVITAKHAHRCLVLLEKMT